MDCCISYCCFIGSIVSTFGHHLSQFSIVEHLTLVCTVLYPYDAFVRAIRKIYKETLGRKFPMLTNYAVTIPPGGRTDAFVQTTISWSFEDKIFKTRGLDADQTEAAIKATMKMLNIIEKDYENVG